MSSERHVEITVNLTANDLFRASMALSWKSLAHITALLGLLSALWVATDLYWPDSVHQLSSLTLLLICLTALVPPAYVWIILHRSRKVLRDSRVYRNELDYVFTDNSVSACGPTYKGESDWSNVTRVHETRSFIMLFSPLRGMTILPKRCFPDASALNTFRELVRAHVSGKVKLLP